MSNPLTDTRPSGPTPHDGRDPSEGRRGRIEALRADGQDPFPAAAFKPHQSLAEVVAAGRILLDEQTELRLAGRIISRRMVGKAVFIDLFDEGQRLQVYLSPATFNGPWSILDMLDLGDFVGVDGVMFETRRGERTVEVRTLTILGKGVLAPPLGKRDADGAFHQALADTGQRLRDRHVALLVDPELRRRIILRDVLTRELRAYFHDEGFIELETPVLNRAYGGAAPRGRS